MLRVLSLGLGCRERGSVGAWEHGSVGAWEYGSVGVEISLSPTPRCPRAPLPPRQKNFY